MFNRKTDKKKTDLCFNGFYRGEVVDTNDPLRAGRVRVRVFSVFDDLSAGTIPWAIMADPFMGGQAGFGGFFVPDIGSHVWVFFETGDPEQPVYFAGAPARPHGPPEKDTNYPLNHVYKTRTGHLIEINDGAGIIHIMHSSGTEVTIDAGGNVEENVVGNVVRNVQGNVTEVIQGNYQRNVSGNTTEATSGDVAISGARIDMN